jgi:hypothetical protein
MTNGKVLAAPARPSFAKAKFTKSHSYEKPRARKTTRVLKWSAGRRRGRGPRHADGCCHPPTLRAWRAPQNDPLARTACFGRAAPPGAPPPLRLSAAAVDRRRLRATFRSCQSQLPVGVLSERIDLLCNGKRDGCQGEYSQQRYNWENIPNYGHDSKPD